jgi:hypothetical protein
MSNPDTPVSSGPLPSPTASQQPPAAPGEDSCGAGKAARFVGQIATPATRAEVSAAVGHTSIRWIRPGDAVTMDYSESRLNADLDARDKIVGFRCG